jgi:histidine phosphotransferase ChpT
MTVDSLLLSELLCARLCHDLAGPLGAAAAGAELIEDGCGDDDTLSLVSASAAGAVARLKLFRAAFGPAARPQGAQAVRDLILGYFEASGAAQLSLDWQVDAAELTADMARLILNLTLLACDCLPRGGAVAVTSRRSSPGLTVVASGHPAMVVEEARPVLENGAEPRGPRAAQAFLACRLAESQGGRLVAETWESAVVLSVGNCSPPLIGQSRK